MAIGKRSGFGITNVIEWPSVSFEIAVYGFRAVVYMQLFVNIVYVLAHRTMTNKKLRGNLLVQKAVGKQLQDFILAVGKNLLLCLYLVSEYCFHQLTIGRDKDFWSGLLP